MATQYNTIGTITWKEPATSAATLPTVGNLNGDARVTTDTDSIYIWNGSTWILAATPAGAGGITSLSGDVTATGPGAAAATVNSVGGASAASIAAAATANASATSANTPNTLVKRDGSGNFAAGTITASLTGDASLDLPLNGARAMTGALNMGTHLINNVTDPSSAQDAATKNYVDSAGAATSIGALDAQAANAQGLALVSHVLSTQSADATHPGMVNNTTQTFSGVKTFSSAINAGGNKITNGADPTTATDFATKAYTDALVNGLSWKAVVRSATTTALPTYTYSNGASGVGATITAIVVGALPAQDGVTMIAGDRLLVKNETAGNAPYNGIYTVTVAGSVGLAFILTRSTDDDTSAEMTDATVEVSPEASTQGGFGYRQTTANPTMGTSAITWVNFTIGTAYTFTNGVKLVGSVVSADVDNTTIDITGTSLEVKAGGISNTQISNSAAIAYSKLNLTGSIVNADITNATINLTTKVTGALPIANGGTGQTTANAGFNALSPMTTGGDLIYGGASGVATRLANGTAGQVLQSNGTTLAPTWVTSVDVPGGSNTQIQFNDSGVFGGSANLTFIKATGLTSWFGSSKLTIDPTYTNGFFGQTGPSVIVNSDQFNGATNSSTFGSSNTTTAGTKTTPINYGSGDNSANSAVGDTGEVVSTSGSLTGTTTTAKTGRNSVRSGDVISGSGNTGPVLLKTGDAIGGGNSGAITIQTGSGASRGAITLNGGSISANSTKINSVADPTSAQDAATKAYVDVTRTVAQGGTGSTSFTAGSIIFAGAGGTTLTQDNANLFFDDTNNRLGVGTNAPTATFHVVQAAATSGTPNIEIITGGAHTGLASVEAIDVNYNLSRTVSFGAGGGTIAQQRAINIDPVTYTAAAATTITTAATLNISGPPVASTNITMTNQPLALLTSGRVQFKGGGNNTTLTNSSFYLDASSLVAGTGMYAAAGNSMTSGKLVDLRIASTGSLTNQTVLNIDTSGANGTGAQTTYGIQVANNHSGTSTNIAGYFSATNGSNNYAAIFNAGNVGVGTAAPTSTLTVNGSFARNIVTVTGATYTVLTTDTHIIANRAGTITVTLPAAASFTGRELSIRTIQAQTVVSNASDTVPLVGGAAGTAILAATAGKWALLVSDGTNWQIQSGN